jgi:hypothetical protein
MTMNGAPVRALHGRSKDGSGCRAPACSERETLGHVLGVCPKGELLRNARHHRIRSLIADELREMKRYEVYEEIPCIGAGDGSRRLDILVIDRREKKFWILDPTIRMETNPEQPTEVDHEKKAIYEPTFPDLMERYQMQGYNSEVIGLMIGSRGTIPKFFENFRKRFLLPASLTQRIVISVLKDSSHILHNHLYNQQPITPA